MTCVKCQLPVKVIVIKNDTLGMIKWEQMSFLGNPEFGCELQDMSFAAFANACGVAGFTIREPADCQSTLKQTLATPGPAIVEPPMPPKITLDQASKFAQSLAKGHPHRGKIALTILSDKVRELV